MPINAHEVDTIIIAGVGTALAVQMLKQRPEVVSQAKQLILQPQFECEEMRRYLHSINFKIAGNGAGSDCVQWTDCTTRRGKNDRRK